MESAEEIAARLADFKVTGDLTRLWPDVPRALRIAAQRQILAVTKNGLGATGTPAVLNAGVSKTRALSVAAQILGVGPLLGYWAEHCRLDTSAEMKALLVTHLDYGRRRAQGMRQRFLEILESCNRNGIVPVVLKGMYTGSKYFPEPGTRPTSDIDLLVEPDALSQAREALQQLGLEEVELSHGQSTWRPAGDEPTVRSLDFEHPDNPWSVDLHTYIDRRYFWGLWSRFGNRPFSETQPWSYEGLSGRVFRQPLLVAYLAQHAVHDFRWIRLLRFVEIIQVLRRDLRSGELTWDALASHLEETRTTRFAFPAFEVCSRLAPDVIDAGFHAELTQSATPRLRRVIDRWWNVGVGVVDGIGVWEERLMWAETPFQHLQNVAHQVARRGMALLSPVHVGRLRLSVRRWTGIAP